MLRPRNALSVAVIAAWTAHVLAWAAGAYLAFGPIYQGVEYRGVAGRSEPSSSTLNPEEWTHYSETLIEANGLGAVLYLIIPLILTGIAVWTTHRTDFGNLWRKVLIWFIGLAFFGLCVMTLLSVGSLYLPAAFALIITAVAYSIAKGATRQ